MKKYLLLSFSCLFLTIGLNLFFLSSAAAAPSDFDCYIVNPSLTAQLQSGKSTKEEGGKTYFPPDTQFLMTGEINQKIEECRNHWGAAKWNVEAVPLDGNTSVTDYELNKPIDDRVPIPLSASFTLHPGAYCIRFMVEGQDIVDTWFSYDPIQGSTGIKRFEESDTTSVTRCGPDYDVTVYIREADPDRTDHGDFSERIYACGTVFTPIEGGGDIDENAVSRNNTCPQDHICCPSNCPAQKSGEVGTPDPVRWVCGYDGSLIVEKSPTPLPPPQLCQNSIGSTPDTCDTGLGSISTGAGGFIKSLLAILLSASGMIALYLIIRSGYQLMSSRGNTEVINEARERLISAIIGLLFIIFSLLIFQVVTVDLFHIPGIGN